MTRVTLCGATGDLRHKKSLATGKGKLLKYLKHTNYSHLHSFANLGETWVQLWGIWVKNRRDSSGVSSLSPESLDSGRERRLGSGQRDQMCRCIYSVSKAAAGLRQRASHDNWGHTFGKILCMEQESKGPTRNGKHRIQQKTNQHEHIKKEEHLATSENI